MTLPTSYRAPWDLNAIVAGNPFLSDLGLEFLELGTEGAVFELEAKPRHMNAEGSIQGGVIASMLDAACGLPVRVVAEGRELVEAVTLTLSIDYVGAASTDRVRATGRVTGGGATILFSRAEMTDAKGALVATASASFKRLRRPASISRNEEQS